MATSSKKNSSKKKFVQLSEIENALLPGRHKCDCEASVHELICNCLNCGRIVCEQENVGSCFTCGRTVNRVEIELAKLNKEIVELKLNQKDKNQKLPSAPAAKSLKEIASSLISIESATEHKNKLLEYERTSEKRTIVIDDEMDYFDLSKENWLSNEKRQELKDKIDKLHEDKFEIDRRFELDFDSRQVVEVNIPKIKDLNEEVKKLKEETEFKSDYEIVDFREILANEPEVRPYYVAENDNKNNKKDNKKDDKKPKSKSNKNQKQSDKNLINYNLPNINLVRNRLQNSELFDSTDEGFALSINQPWASLVIHSIKLHEGRTWLTTYRGPLWIHASAKSPRREEIEEACSFFRLILGDQNVKFPDHYPLGCLIGRVYLNDCIAQEEYRSNFGNMGYLEDPYVFIFTDVIKLKATVPCSGKQKIFKLDKSIFKVASSQIVQTYDFKK